MSNESTTLTAHFTVLEVLGNPGTPAGIQVQCHQDTTPTGFPSAFDHTQVVKEFILEYGVLSDDCKLAGFLDSYNCVQLVDFMPCHDGECIAREGRRE